MSIPKIIHYFYDNVNIWEKNQKSQVRMCINSWLKYCPDYKPMLWHDKMPEFQDILKRSEFVRRAYKLKLWAFVSDYVRLYALNKYGGIYLDTDVELLKNFDDFLENKFFTSIEGDILNGKNIPEPAIMGGIANHPVFKETMKIYETEEIFKTRYCIANIILQKTLLKLYDFNKINYTALEYEKLAEKYYNKKTKKITLDNFTLYKNQKIFRDKNNEIAIYPSEYFCPTWGKFQTKAFTGNTVAIHWNQSSWWDNDEKMHQLISGNIANKDSNVKQIFYFAGLIPLLYSDTKLINKDKNIKIYKLFNIIPLIKTTKNKDKIRCYLFNFLPLWKIKNYHCDKMHYLFQTIPLFRIKETYYKN